MTQRQLADLSMVSLRAIRNLELGVTGRPRIDTLRLIVEGLGLSPAEGAELERAADHAEGGLAAGQTPVTRLPSALDRLIDRDDEVDAIARSLVEGQQRLHVLTGLGGVGKTRIAMEVANRLHRNDPLPVLWTSNTAQTHTDPVAQAIRLWLDGAGVDGVALGKVLGARASVLVLDGFEPTPPRQARLVELLWEYSDLRVLVTGRAPVDVLGEQVVPISPLHAIDPADAGARDELAGTAAMRLFVRTACLAKPDFRLDEVNLPLAARLCHELDGVPGVVKTAAALLQIYEPHALVEHVTDDLLGFAAGVVSSKELTRLLDPDDGRLLPSLAALPGGWSVSDVVDHTGLPASRCADLVRRLLVLGAVRPCGRSGERRFRVLNLIRDLYWQKGVSHDRTA
jgi:transcriptional regulator with XRE-family HTH domain